uniref:FAD-binding FR-type domain-containing protein n=1 Tax=Cucumis melo TaxID=3656 RepID=A0A9I9DJL9_CUCME
MFINVPSVSKLQWHPFTVTSNCKLEPDTVSVVIKSGGTSKLHKQLSSSLDHLQVFVEGPWASFYSLFKFYLLLISGGSGITPFFSIIRETTVRSTKLNFHISQIRLIYAFKKSINISLCWIFYFQHLVHKQKYQM